MRLSPGGTPEGGKIRHFRIAETFRRGLFRRSGCLGQSVAKGLDGPCAAQYSGRDECVAVFSRRSSVSEETPRSRVIVLVVLSLAVAMLVAGFPAIKWVYDRRLHSLFLGPTEETQHAARGGDYRGVDYDLTSYERKAPERPVDNDTADRRSLLEKPQVDKEWERSIEGMHRDWKLDAVGGATRVARLKSPTVYKAPLVPRFLTITHPPDNAIFPPNLCPPFIEWGDASNNFWEVTLEIPGTEFNKKGLALESRWRIPDDAWTTIRQTAVEGRKVRVHVKGILRKGFFGKARDTIHRSKNVHFTVSADPADEAIVYRLVDPPFINKKTPDLFVRRLDRSEDRLFLSADRQYCVNCHTFSSKAGDRGRLSLQVRYIGPRNEKHRVYFALYDIEARRGRRIILPFDVQMTTFMDWSPDGAKLAFAANQKVTAFSPVVFETQSIAQPTSDLAVFDTDTAEVSLVPGASERDLVEIYPAWTPDGKSLVFSATTPGKHPAETKFGLYLIRCEPASREKPKPQPLLAGVDRDKSKYFARFSPDGQWMSWVQSDYGSLIKASSDIHLMNWKTKEHRKLTSNVAYAADSWHSWSSNSRWLVFASKRDDGLFARLYLTHIDDAGNASPPVRLPLVDPKMRLSFNIPEFVAKAPPVTPDELLKNVGIDADVQRPKLRSETPHGDAE